MSWWRQVRKVLFQLNLFNHCLWFPDIQHWTEHMFGTRVLTFGLIDSIINFIHLIIAGISNTLTFWIEILKWLFLSIQLEKRGIFYIIPVGFYQLHIMMKQLYIKYWSCQNVFDLNLNYNASQAFTVGRQRERERDSLIVFWKVISEQLQRE